MVDINNFKQFNDTCGHLRGDELLECIAGDLKKSVRSPDFVVRYGGDEFVIVMPESGRVEATRLAERLETGVRVSHMKKAVFETEGKISISTGIATFPDEAQDIGKLIHLADLNLYESKQMKNNAMFNEHHKASAEKYS